MQALPPHLPTSNDPYRGKPTDIRRVGDELKVRYATEGSVRRVGGTLRVNVQLVATETGTHFWADHFDIGRNGADNNVDDVVREIGLALTRLERSLAIAPDVSGWRQLTYRFLAAAYARIGRLPEAKRAIAEPDRLFPYDTVRAHWPDDPSSPVYAEQIRHFQEGLRLAGERDHADEGADFGVPADRTLHNAFAGLTSTSALGVTTIRTAELASFLAKARPIVIDVVSYSWGRSLPGAVGLRSAGLATSPTWDRTACARRCMN